MNSTASKVTVVIVALVVGVAGGFYGGMKYQQGKTPAATAARTGATGAAGAAGRRFGFGGAGASGANSSLVSGQIISQNSNSITVQSSDGSTKMVILPGSASILKTDQGSASDLTVGTNVMVVGTSNSDGSVTAQNVQIRPAGFGTSTPASTRTPAQ